MMPVLMAEESMRETERISVGTGVLKREDSRQIVRGWRRDAERSAPRRVKSPPASPDVLAAVGIGFQIVEPA